MFDKQAPRYDYNKSNTDKQTNVLSSFQYYTDFLGYFPEMYKIWFPQINLLSIITPRNFVLEFSVICSQSMLICIYIYIWVSFIFTRKYHKQ